MASLRISDSDFEQQLIMLQLSLVLAGGSIPVKLRIDSDDFEQQLIALQLAVVAAGGTITPQYRISDSDFEQQMIALQVVIAAGFSPAMTMSFTPAQSTSTPNVSAGSHAALQWERTQAWSCGAKIKVAAKPVTSGANIVFTTCNENDGVYRGYELWINDAGQLQVRIISTFGSNYIGVKGTKNVCDGAWHTVFATYSGSSTAAGVKLYVDGVLETMTTEADTLSATIVNTQPLLIGNQTGWPFSLGGSLAEFSLSKVVRSGATIAAYSTALAAVDTNTVLAYNFSEGSGTTTADLSASGFTGTLHNAKWPSSSYVLQSATSASLGNTPAASTSVTLPAAVTNGSVIAGMVVLAAATSAVTITDDKGNSTSNGKYVIDQTNTGFAGVPCILFHGIGITNGPKTITIALNSGTGTFWFACCDELAGFSAVDGSALTYVASGGTNLTSGNITTTAAGDVIWGACSCYTSGSCAAGTGFATIDNFSDANSNMATESKLLGAAGATAATFTSAATQAHTGGIAFKK